MKFFLISDNIDTLMGMRLSGIEGVVVHEKHEVKSALNQALSDSEIAVILITQKLVTESSELVYDLKLNRKTPLIIEIPDRHGTGRKKDFITSYVNEAIGLKL